MKHILMLFLLLSIALTTLFADYMTSFSASVKNWNNSNIQDALSLVQLSLSSTVNISYAPDLWYFRSRLELMLGKLNEAENSLQTAISVFHPKPVYKLLSALAQASMTFFSPVSRVTFENEIKGFYGGEVFYSPVSVALRKTSYYVLDEANRFVEEFGVNQNKYPLSVNSTPISMVYSPKMDTFFVSFENGNIYTYNPTFSKRALFKSGLSYPLVSYVDNFGRVYVVEAAKDRVTVLESDGEIFKTFDFFSHNRVHILGYVRESCGVMYVMDFTQKAVRRFNLVSGRELSPVPFPKGELPSSFELLGSTIVFISSHRLSIGGIDFPIENSGVFYSSLSGRLLMVCDVQKNVIKMYEMFTHSNLFIPIIDRMKFQNGKAEVFFRILDPLGEDVENANRTVINDNGFTKAITTSRVKASDKLYLFPQPSKIFQMNKNVQNVVVMKTSTLKGHMKSFFSAVLLNHVSLYLVRDANPSQLEKEVVTLTRGDFISEGEIPYVSKFMKKLKPFEFKAVYSIPLPQGVDEVDLFYGGNPTFVDSAYYTLQNVLK